MPFPVHRDDKSGMVICQSKGCQAIGPKGETEQEAVDKWNHRSKQLNKAPPTSPLDLQDFATRLLSPLDLPRDENGLLKHHLMQIADEETNIGIFLSNFGMGVDEQRYV